MFEDHRGEFLIPRARRDRRGTIATDCNYLPNDF